MNTDYKKMAKDFLTKTGTTFQCEYLKNGFHFAGDADKRDIYKITLSRESRSYSFNFGQSLNDSGFYVKMGRRIEQLDRKLLTDKYLLMKVKRMFHNFMPNIDTIHKPVEPAEYDVLACLTKYDPGTFEDFCSEFGYNTDSKKVEKTYKAVCEEFKNVQTIWTDAEIEELQEIN